MKRLAITLIVAACVGIACSSADDTFSNGATSGTCDPGQACSCAGNGSCSKTCTGVGCTLECTGNGACSLDCPKGLCTVTCKGNGACSVTSCTATNDCTCKAVGTGSCSGGKG